MLNTAVVTRLLVGLVFGSVTIMPWPIAGAKENDKLRIPILVYHRFGATAADGMTVTLSLFESHLKFLRDNGYQTIPLRRWLQNRLTAAPELPLRSVVITVDDGHRSVYTHMLSLARVYHVPVTLVVYLSAVSNAAYALTWPQFVTLKESGLFDIQSHSYWHPNFKNEKRRLSQGDYEKLVQMQLQKSKMTLEKQLGSKVDLLAWPFGIFDDELMGKAVESGYTAAFTLEGRYATRRDPIMALPRYLVTQAYQMKTFKELLEGNSAQPGKGD
jgi:peptidoglycan/xylan/chitin deacetylase (PgdA/CDA1 family)